MDYNEAGSSTLHALTGVYVAVLHKSIDLVAVAYDATVKATTPFYDEHLAQKVEPVWRGTVIPFYEEETLPKLELAAELSSENAMLLVTKVTGGVTASWSLAKEVSFLLHGELLDRSEMFVTKVHGFLKDHKEQLAVPEGVVIYLKSVQVDPALFVNIYLQLFIFAVIVVATPLWSSILLVIFKKGTLVMGLIGILPYWLVWKVFWFFCPLRMLVKKRVAMNDEETVSIKGENDESADGSDSGLGAEDGTTGMDPKSKFSQSVKKEEDVSSEGAFQSVKDEGGDFSKGKAIYEKKKWSSSESKNVKKEN